MPIFRLTAMESTAKRSGVDRWRVVEMTGDILTKSSDWYSEEEAVAFARDQSASYKAPSQFLVIDNHSSYLSLWQNGIEKNLLTLFDL